MIKNQELYEFIRDRADELTENWYNSLDKDRNGVYGTQNPDEIKLLKAQNKSFHLLFAKLFDPEMINYDEEVHRWVDSISKDTAHQMTPLEEIIAEFFRIETQYMQLIEKYVIAHADQFSAIEVMKWSKGVTDSVNGIILEFTHKHMEAAEKRLNAQQEMIVEMSAPVIRLTDRIGLLPLIGEITTYRAQVIFEKALTQCAEKKFERLFIDLSGVPIIDTMVAHQIFQLIKGLRLIGVQTSLSGMSPEIAQTAVHLGLDFKDIKMHSSLSRALELYIHD
ncbi:STAS domain-containing protein [Chryseomicrobium palamuruense]